MATIYTVTQLNAYVGNLFREDFLLAGLRVQGELSNVKYHASGHIYFTLKDSGAELRGIIYRQNALGLDMRLADGMQVVCTGAVTVYEKAGVYQLNTKTVEKQGEGELYALYQARLRALEAEGLFDAAHKKPLPRFVLTLGRARAARRFMTFRPLPANRIPMSKSCSIRHWCRERARQRASCGGFGPSTGAVRIS